MKIAIVATAVLALAAPAVSVFAAQAASSTQAVKFTAASGSEVEIAGEHVMLMSHGLATYTPPLAHRRLLPSIFNNFATNYPKGLYNASNGLQISGPDTIFGQSWLAAAFTPTASATVHEIDAAMTFINGSKDVVKFALYSDASGLPGTVLWSGRATLPTFGTCCAIVALHDKDGVALTAGTQYWLGITTLPRVADFMGAWDLNVLDQVDSNLIAINRGSGWSAQQAVPNLAFGIYGK